VLHILLIEDNPGDTRLITELLKEADELIDSHKLYHVERVGEAEKVLAGNTPIDIVLSDITLPDSQGLDTFESLQGAAAHVPLLFMTGSNDDELAVAAIHKGAQDYMVKGHITSDGLARAILYAIERTKFQAEMKRATDKIQDSQQRVELLAAQKKQLLALGKAKDEFISLASHQLRTPATAVKQCIGMILEGYAGDVAEQQSHLLKTAYDSNDRQLRIINDLLRTAQLDSNMYRLKIAPHDLTRIIAEVLSEHRTMFELREQQVTFDETKPQIVPVDADEIKLVIANLLENASKYTPHKKSIHIVLERDGSKMQLTVRDEGVGISKKDQKHIFEKFTRIDNALSDTVDGTGLGLYWARQIVRLHKGSITVDSEIGQGSSFVVRLPL
jgi:signal transduction histidine kinase